MLSQRLSRIAPMNSSQFKNRFPRGGWHQVILFLSLSLLVACNLLPLAAQVKTAKRITSVWTATTAEGSRVHVDSDAPVNDYEAYTQGGRFYVKIPLADLPSARGSLLGRGFDDVQIQRYGDGIIISFRLQPGTAARVEQAANRLEVVFTTAGSRIAVAGTKDIDYATRTRARRTSDLAGPAPATSPTAAGASATMPRPTRHRTVHSAAGSSPTGQGVRNSDSSAATRNSDTTVDAPGKAPGARANGEGPASIPKPYAVPSPVASPTPTPSVVSGVASTGASPLPSATIRPRETLPSPTPKTAAGATDNDWKSRAHYWRVWVDLNWLPIVIGVLVVMALLTALFFWRAIKRTRSETAAWFNPGVDGESVGRKETGSAGQSWPSARGDRQGQATVANPSPSANATPGRPVKEVRDEQEREVFEL